MKSTLILAVVVATFVTSAPVFAQTSRAQLTPVRYTTLAAETSAKIDQISVKEGDKFQTGQILVRFDCDAPNAILQRAQAALTNAELTLRANEALEKLNSVGKLELQSSLGEVEKAKAEVAAQQVAVSKCNVAAPFSGRVVEQQARANQFVQIGQPLLQILDDSDLEVEFVAPSSMLRRLGKGARFSIRIDEVGRTYPARVVRVGARVDPLSKTIKVFGKIEGRRPELLAGMSGEPSFGSAPAGQ